MKLCIAVLLNLAATFAAGADLSGEWIAQVTRLGESQYVRVNLIQDGAKLTGTWGKSEIEGSVAGSRVKFSFRGSGPSGSFDGAIDGAELSGQGAMDQRRGSGMPQAVAVKMQRAVASPKDGAKTWDFHAREFHSTYSSAAAPALRIFPGDQVRTSLLDDDGVDSKMQQRAGGSNPQIGPFYIEGALPGDTLVVKLTRVRVNRDSAQSGSRIKANLVDPAYLSGAKYEAGFNAQWTLDSERGVARLTHPTEHMKNYTVPIRPMIGCIATAPPFHQSIRTLDLGPFGGNMDYNQVGEGATLYLPVFEPGALLFMGDGHAAMGDGEVTFAAVETSLDVEFTVDILKGSAIAFPRVENQEYLMAMGIAGSLDEATRIATSQMANWLKRDYRLSDNEVALVMGTALKYDIAEMVDPQYNVVAKIPKLALAPFK
jgi:amidase